MSYSCRHCEGIYLCYSETTIIILKTAWFSIIQRDPWGHVSSLTNGSSKFLVWSIPLLFPSNDRWKCGEHYGAISGWPKKELFCASLYNWSRDFWLFPVILRLYTYTASLWQKRWLTAVFSSCLKTPVHASGI